MRALLQQAVIHIHPQALQGMVTDLQKYWTQRYTNTSGIVPLNVREEWEELLMGLSLKNIEVTFYDGDKKVFTDFGEMLFTHFGVSGPVILSASDVITGIVKERPVRLSIDLKPAITDEQLDERILRDFSKEQNKAFKNSLDELLLRSLFL